jgi:hypothetical protein
MSDLAMRRSAAAAGAAMPSTGVDGATRAWRTLTTPFWIWSDVPAPDLPAREPDLPETLGLAGEVFLKGLDGIRTRLWVRAMVQGVFRGAWLALLGTCIWMAWSLMTGGPPLDLRLTGMAMAIGAVIGLAVGVCSKPSRARTAAMLDRTWLLQERMTTAVEGLGRSVPASGERAAIPYLQMADGANTVEQVKRDLLLAVRPPVREIVLAVFWALSLAALAFLRGVGGEPPDLVSGYVPVFSPAAELPAAVDLAPDAQAAGDAPLSAEDAVAKAQESNQARQDLQALAQALADHAVTRRAAEAIGQGDYERAADELRQLAPDAPQLSEGARQDLAADLDRSAESMSEGTNGLRPAAQESASGLRQGEKPAQEGLRSLAEAVETAGQQVAPQAELADMMRAAQQRDPEGFAEAQRRMQEEGAPRQQGDAQGQGQQGEQTDGEPGDPGKGSRAGGSEGDGTKSDAGQGEKGAGDSGNEGAASGGEGDQQTSGDRSQGTESGAGRGEQEGDAPRSGQGGGAGSGDSADREATRRSGTGSADGESEAKPGPAPEQRVTEGDGALGDDGDQPQVGDESISLPSGQGGQQGVQTSADGGSALPGAGTGVTAGNGSAVQGEVGESGPDSNHVPAEYRDIVQNYFSGTEGQR